MRKHEIVNQFSRVFGDGSTLQVKQKYIEPKTLAVICKSYIQSKLPKQFLNAAFASFRYPSEYQGWVSSSPFGTECKVDGTRLPQYWYTKPKLIHSDSDSRYLLDFLDPEHLLTNMRTKVCTIGINKAGIKREAWIQVAKYGKQNGSNLSLALVEHLLDKQNVAFAIKTFSEEFEIAMKNAGYHTEANFCGLIRNWYRAQDEPGLSCYERHLYEQSLRQWLLEDVRFEIFPPPGRYVKDIPIVLYEGLLIHIDRRSQLYAFTNGAYNARSIGTFDIENLFGAFQDWDAKGTGVLRADEVPEAMLTACDLYNTRLNEARGFYMHTSASRVYPVPPMTKHVDILTTETYTLPTEDNIRRLGKIIMRDHVFDQPERKHANPKRKKGTISSLGEPSKGIKSVREERYKLNESKILPHVRAGINLEDLKM
ncbi:unnamed protein product [Mytilus coruscus]|uniref:Uncharacterized protein n=1 Tax=Mytilus coruscus TaxID=42192 RepID=A0A6J8EU11_MYTCO|nr:unnamed protein product [Mytilus coruscus]